MTAPAEVNDGRIPFRIRIGVTGHRDLSPSPELAAAVRSQLSRVVDLFPVKRTEVCVSIVSQLAEGADRIVVREALDEKRKGKWGAQLETVLPLERQEYIKAQGFDRDSVVELDSMLGRAIPLYEPSAGSYGDSVDERAAAYAAAGRQLVDRCDVLLALWDGNGSGGLGGTAETLVRAAAQSKPCIWICTEGRPTVRDNLDPGQGEPFYREVVERAQPTSRPQWISSEHSQWVMDPVMLEFKALERFNKRSRPWGYSALLRKELAEDEGISPWVAPSYVRATILAMRWRRWFQWMARGITLFATIAAVMLALSLSFGKETEGWSWAEAIFFFLALVGLTVVRRVGFHRRWLSYRTLAERLRCAHFLAPTGVDFRRQAQLDAAYVGRASTDWLIRAVEEVWDDRPKLERRATDLEPAELRKLKAWLADVWIGEQIAYHEKAMKRHHRWHRALASAVTAFFLATIVFACLHGLHMTEDTAIFLCITLPAAGASVGVLLTVNQHQALSERSARMRADLAAAQIDVRNATADALDSTSFEAARTMSQETGAWFGLMWFLDIEHP